VSAPDEELEMALEALATGRDDLVPEGVRARIEADPALREQLAESRALTIDLGMALRDAPTPEVDLDALVSRAMDAAPSAPSRRSLWLAGIGGLAATLGLGLAAMGGLPPIASVRDIGDTGWTALSLLDRLLAAFPGGYPGLGLTLFAVALILALPLRALTRNGAPALVALLAVFGSSAVGQAQRFDGVWPAGESVAVDADGEAASEVLRRACEAAGVGYVSHLEDDRAVTVHVQDAPLRDVLAAVLPPESVATRSGDLVVVRSEPAATEAPPAPTAPAPPQATATPPIPPVPPMPPANQVLAERVTMGEDVTVAANEVVSDIATMGGDVIIDGQVTGDVLTMGGDAEVRGLIRGALVTMGGDISFEDEGRVLGEVLTMGGSVDRDGQPSAEANLYEHDDGHGPVAEVLGSAARHGLFFLLGVLLIGAFPRRHATIARALVDRPVRSAAAGFLGVLATFVLCLAFAITLVGIPVAIFVGVLAVVAGCAGFAVVGYVIGAALPFERSKKKPLMQLGIGILILWGLSLVPVLGFLLLLVLGSAGYGAVLTTRFGKPSEDG